MRGQLGEDPQTIAAMERIRFLLAQQQAAPAGEVVAWLHTVVQDDGTQDEALSFSPSSFPLEGVGGFRSIGRRPLFTAAAAGDPVGYISAHTAENLRRLSPDGELMTVITRREREVPLFTAALTKEPSNDRP
jgi:hypothetical protein